MVTDTNNISDLNNTIENIVLIKSFDIPLLTHSIHDMTSINLYVYLSIGISIYLSINLYVYLSIGLSIYLSIYLS